MESVAAPPPNARLIGGLGDLHVLGEAPVNMVLHDWRPSRALRAMIAEASATGFPELEAEVAGADLERLAALHEAPLVRRLFAEVTPVLGALDTLVATWGAGRSRYRIELSEVMGRTCPLFHVDRVAVRLLVTLCGAGTEWLSDASCDRRGLGKGSNDKVVRDPAGVYRLAPFQVGLLKGDAFPLHRGRGVVHRSPPADCGPGRRWVLRVDWRGL